MNFLFDNNLPPELARAFDVLSQKDGHRAMPLRDKFPEATGDEHWIPTLIRERHWAVVSRDRFTGRTRSGLPERVLLQHRSLAVFILGRGWRAFHRWDLVWRLARWWPTLTETANNIQGGVGYLVPKDFPGHKQRKLQVMWTTP